MPTIHPTSVIEDGATLADDVIVGPLCHVGPRVTLGPATRLLSHVSIAGRTTLGAHNTVWPQTVLGADPQDLKYKGEDTQLIIGDHNDIREIVSIHKGTVADQGITRIGSHNLIMAYAHIGHDCELGDHLVITNAVQLAGHIRVEDHAAIGGASAVHHFCTIGQYAYIGGLTRIVHDVHPFMFVEGNPARVRNINAVGLRRHGFAQEQEDHLKEAWRRLYKRSAEGAKVGDSTRAMAELEAAYPDDWCIQALIASIRRAAQGVHGRHRESKRADNRYTNPVK